ncbi:MAG: hypothetical protein ACTSRQ_16275 [Candidatus Thorarchaeota archaeon]
MSDFSDMIRILTLVSEHETIEGRTRFQKLVFLLKTTNDIPFSFEFTPYYYGPYSYDLSDYLSNLVSFNLLEESRTHLRPDIYRYDYTLTNKGQEVLKKIRSELEDLEELELVKNATQELEIEPTNILVRRAKAIMAKISEPT